MPGRSPASYRPYPMYALPLVVALPTLAHCLRWCVTDSGLNQQLCTEMQQDLQRRNGSMDFRCVYGLHTIDCMHQVRNGAADAMNLDPEEIYVAGRYLGLKVALSEKISGHEFVDQSYVVVRKSSLRSAQLQSLAGKKLCLPGVDEQNIHFHTMADVLLPLGLVATKHINCQSPARTVASHFGPSCMPGRWAVHRISKGHQCALCQGDCSPKDRYASELGALHCLIEQNADVAVTNGRALSTYSRGPRALSPSKFKLLCLQGSLADLDEPCSWMARRNNAIVMSPLAKSERQQAIRDGLRRVFRAFNKSKPVWFRRILVSSSNITDLVDAHSGGYSYKRYLGSLFVRSMVSPFSSNDCDPPQLRLCFTGASRARKCKDIAMAWSSIRIKPALHCQQVPSHLQCIRNLLYRKSDLALLHPSQAVHAYVQHGFVPLAVEEAANDTRHSYLIAVLKKGKRLTPGRLYGVKACFSSAQLRDIVLILLQRLGILRMDNCHFDRMGSDFFAPACQQPSSKIAGGNSICTVCNNVAEGKTVWQYGSNNGSREIEDDADIAFVELSADGLSELQMASNLFMLMCPNGTRRTVGNYANCSWLSTTGGAVVSSTERLTSDTRTRLTELLIYVQNYYERKRPNDRFTIFSNRLEGYSLFDKQTTKLKPVWPVADVDYDSALSDAFGEETFDTYKRWALCKSDARPPNAPLTLFFSLAVLTARMLT